MGTNYYLHRNICPHCQRPDDIWHIGKSSGGWCFSLHVDPTGIDLPKDLKGWQLAFGIQGHVIKDEYGKKITSEAMVNIITWRMNVKAENMDAKFLSDNHAENGPNGLLRRIVDGRHTIAHGDGTYDYCVGEFS